MSFNENSNNSSSPEMPCKETLFNLETKILSGFPDYSNFYESHKSFLSSLFVKLKSPTFFNDSERIDVGKGMTFTGKKVSQNCMTEGIIQKDENVQIYLIKDFDTMGATYAPSVGEKKIFLNLQMAINIEKISGIPKEKILAMMFAQELCHCRECGKNESLSEVTSFSVLGNDFFYLRLLDFVQYFSKKEEIVGSIYKNARGYETMMNEYKEFLPNQMQIIQEETKILKELNDYCIPNVRKLIDASYRKDYKEEARIMTEEKKFISEMFVKYSNPILVKQDKKEGYVETTYNERKMMLAKKYPQYFLELNLVQAIGKYKKGIIERYQQ